MKDKEVFNHEHDIIYYTKYPKESFPHGYVGEYGRTVLEQVKDSYGRDNLYHIFKHCVVADHQFVSYDDLRIVVRIYCNNKRKWEIAKIPLSKNQKPLNVQKKSVALKLFN